MLLVFFTMTFIVAVVATIIIFGVLTESDEAQ